MKVAISGGSGFVGTYLMNYLLEHHYEVLIISRSPKKLTNRASTITWQELDQDCKPIEHLEAWINLAGETINQRWTAAAKSRILDSRVSTVQQIASLINKLQHKPKVFINSSAVGIYGTSETAVFTESSKTHVSDFLSQVVTEWEKATQIMNGIRVVRLRTGLVLGMDGGALPRMVMPYRIGAGGRVGKGTQVVSWIHIIDLVRIFETCITNDRLAGPVNATGPNPVTMDQFGRTIAKVWHRPHFLPVPEFALKLLFGEMAILVLEGQRVMPEAIMKEGFSFSYPDLEAALRQLKTAQI